MFLRVQRIRIMSPLETRWIVTSWMYDGMDPGREEPPSLCPCFSGMWLWTREKLRNLWVLLLHPYLRHPRSLQLQHPILRQAHRRFLT